jgi:tRNA (guanine37-N1)-methyltransferase
MPVPCVRVDPEDGEATRQRLAERDLVDRSRRITTEEGQLYIPVSDLSAVPSDLKIVDYDAPARETQTTPADLLEFDPSYERIGEVVIIDEDDPDRARAIADAIIESDIPTKSVLNRASKIQGQERVRDWEVLYGNETEVVHREYGCEFAVDLAEVYFSPRLATERHRVVSQVESGERVIDMFAGVGPFAIPIAARAADVVGVDINETAVEYLCENARRNDVDDRITAIQGDVTDVAGDYQHWADRIIMNLPHSAQEYLTTAVALASDDCILHYYDIQPDEAPFAPGEQAIREAAEPEYTVTVQTRRTVRSYAPHESNVVLDVRLRK